MNIVFMGTPQFAVPVLERVIADGHTVQAVYTQPDKPVGRGYKLSAPPVKALAQQHGISVSQPQKLRDGTVAAALRALSPDVVVVVAYGRILPPDILEIPRLGCINLHASLLPRWRGAAPIQWSVVAGDEKTGVSSMHMAQGLDTGDVILTEETPIGPDETAPELSGRLSVMGAACISKTLRLLEQGEAPRIPQCGQDATLAPILTKEMGLLDFTKPARELHCLVRGLAGWPAAYTYYDGKLLKIHRAALAAGFSGVPGVVLDKKRLIVGCGEGALELTEVQPQGKGCMQGAAFMNGARIKPNDAFMNR